jgi:hypothetical protein
VDRNVPGHQRMVADALDIVDHSLFLVRNREPLEVFAGARSRTFADVNGSYVSCAVSRLEASRLRIMSLVNNSMPQSV